MRCAYVRHLWDCGESLEIEEKHTGRYGARGQKREKRKKASPEDIKRQNKWKRERDLRRLIKWNFGKYDYWMTITYRKGDRPAWEQMKKDVTDLIKKVRKRYRKLGKELKYIYRLQIGKRGGPHVHILVNRIQTENTGTDMIFTELWTKGHINIRSVNDTGGFADLAEYIAKPLEEWEPEGVKRYHPSRNLIRKEPKQKVINRRSLVDKYGHMIYTVNSHCSTEIRVMISPLHPPQHTTTNGSMAGIFLRVSTGSWMNFLKTTFPDRMYVSRS